MSVESAAKDIQVTVGKDLSTATIQGTRVEVSPDSNVVVYTNDGVQTKPAAGEAAARGTHISEDFNTIVLNGATIERTANGHLVISTPGIVITKPGPANDGLSVPPVASCDVSRLLPAKAKTAIEIGVRDRDGDHKGEIYGGIFPDGKPGWIVEEPKPLTHYEASELKGRALPTSKEGKYIDTIKDKGALRDIFARHSGSSSSAGYFWLAEHGSYGARYQQFSDGSQNDINFNSRYNHLPVLCVRR